MRTMMWWTAKSYFFAAMLAGTSACDSRDERAADDLDAPVPSVARLMLSEEPVLRIGGNDERREYLIQYTSGALRLSDGRIVVADDGTRELRYFDERGRHLKTVGGPGGGPGEFQRLRQIARLKADTIFAWDLIQRRASFFSPDGDVVRTISVSSLEEIQTTAQRRLPQHLVTSSTIYPLHSDRLFIVPLVQPHLQVLPSTHLMQDTVPLFLVGREGQDPIEVGTFPGSEWFYHRVMTGLPFGERLRLAAGEDALYVGSTRSREISIHSGRDGEVIGSIFLPLEARAVDDEDVEAVRSRMIENVVPNARESMVAFVDAVPWPALRPVFSDLRVASDRRVWVQAYRSSDDPSQDWLIFDPSGVHVSSLTMDGSAEFMDAGADYVITQITDDLGLKELRLHTLERKPLLERSNSGTF